MGGAAPESARAIAAAADVQRSVAVINRAKRGFRRGSAPKTGAIHLAAWLCIRVKFIRDIFSRYGQGKVPETARPRQDRAEGPCGGAAKGRYGKCFLSYMECVFL